MYHAGLGLPSLAGASVTTVTDPATGKHHSVLVSSKNGKPMTKAEYVQAATENLIANQAKGLEAISKLGLPGPSQPALLHSAYSSAQGVNCLAWTKRIMIIKQATRNHCVDRVFLLQEYLRIAKVPHCPPCQCPQKALLLMLTRPFPLNWTYCCWRRPATSSSRTPTGGGLSIDRLLCCCRSSPLMTSSPTSMPGNLKRVQYRLCHDVMYQYVRRPQAEHGRNRWWVCLSQSLCLLEECMLCDCMPKCTQLQHLRHGAILLH